MERVAAAPPSPPEEGEGVVERLLNEALSDFPPAMAKEHARRIEELEAGAKAKEARIADLETLLAQEYQADILREELDDVRAHSIRLEECVDRLTKERDRLKAIAEEVETLRSSLDFAVREAAECEAALKKERAESERLAGEVARLELSLEALKRR